MDGHGVLVVLTGCGPLAEKLRDNGVQVVVNHRVAVLKRKSAGSLSGLAQLCGKFVLSVFELFRLAGKFRPDLIHSNSAVVLPAGVVAWLKRIPHVWHIREIFSDFPQALDFLPMVYCCFF